MSIGALRSAACIRYAALCSQSTITHACMELALSTAGPSNSGRHTKHPAVDCYEQTFPGPTGVPPAQAAPKGVSELLHSQAGQEADHHGVSGTVRLGQAGKPASSSVND